MMRGFLFAAAICIAPCAIAADSQCYGKVSKGRLEGGVKLPFTGPNFSSYSTFASTAGRTFVHQMTADILLAAYAGAHRTLPEVQYVYGETGLESGGRIWPHRTHQNGLSVDFFVPVRDAAGKSVPLPTPVKQRFGYDIEFDTKGRYGQYRIDFAAIGEHLYQLDVAARAKGAAIAQVIIDRDFLPPLLATPRGAYLRKELNFMKGKPWVRHDEHYHVDFVAQCKPL